MSGMFVWWQQFGLVMVGGVFGVVLCFMFGDVMLRQFGVGFLWGMLMVNLVGVFVVGYVMIWLQSCGSVVLYWCVFLIVGMVGGLIMFFLMMLESLVFVCVDCSLMVLLYFGISLVGGMLLVWVGVCVVEIWC